MKPTKKTIRLQFTVFPEYADKIKRANTDPFDTDSVYLMKLIDRELASIEAQNPMPESRPTAPTLNKASDTLPKGFTQEFLDSFDE
jgi:hypothetical protein